MTVGSSSESSSYLLLVLDAKSLDFELTLAMEMSSTVRGCGLVSSTESIESCTLIF